MAEKNIATKLAAARTRLIIDKPFLGALVLRLPMVKAKPDWCPTTATDARTFYYSEDYIDALDLEQTQYVLAHEALHCALSHFARRQHRVKKRWDIACDYAINPLLLNDGLKPPPGTLHEDSFNGMTAEEIYPYIEDNPSEETLDQHVYDEDDGEGNPDRPPPQPEQRKEDGQSNGADTDADAGGAPQPSPLDSSDREELSIQWQQRMAGAAQQAQQAGKLHGDMARMVDFLLQPQLPWRMLLARYMTSVARDDYSYTRPSSRRGDPAIFPSMRSAQINMVVALDISGSVTEREMGEFLAEINAIKAQIRARIVLHASDAGLAEGGPWEYEAWENFQIPKHFTGGGGTDFRPLFNWADQLERQPDLLVYFTDAEGDFPPQPPAYPVIWLVKGKSKVPWGQRVQLN